MAATVTAAADSSSTNDGHSRNHKKALLLILLFLCIGALIGSLLGVTLRGPGQSPFGKPAASTKEHDAVAAALAGSDSGNKEQVNMEAGSDTGSKASPPEQSKQQGGTEETAPSAGGAGAGAGGGAGAGAGGAGGGAGAEQDGATTCYVEEDIALTYAVQNRTCPLIILTNTTKNAYQLTRPINVTRRVTIQGNAATLPEIDGSETIRAFRVKAGGFLELRFVRVIGGQGIMRRRGQPYDENDPIHYDINGRVIDAEDALTWENRASVEPFTLVREVRGGVALFETGAVGGLFVGVLFIEAADPVDDVDVVIGQMETLTSERVYGGHVLMMAGEVDFISCIFYDLEILTSFFDRLIFGGDIMLLGGQVTITGSHWLYVTVFGSENGVGLNVLILGGNLFIQFTSFEELNGAVSLNGPGQLFFIGGGVLTLTGIAFNFFQIGEQFAGAGNFLVMGGVVVMTGVSLVDVYGMGFAVGVGLNYVLGGGVFIATGNVINMWNGPFFDTMAGGLMFIGGGHGVFTGCPTIGFEAIGAEMGAGNVIFNGGGHLEWNWSPVIDYVGITSSSMVGGDIYLGGGDSYFLGSPFITAGGIQYFTGLGNTFFQGGGSSIIGFTPVYQQWGLSEQQSPEWWIQGECEPDNQGGLADWKPGVPVFVPNGGGCPFYNRRRELGSDADSADGSEEAEGSGRRVAAASAVTATTDSLLGRSNIGLLAFNSGGIKAQGALKPDNPIIDSAVPEELRPMTRSFLSKIADLRTTIEQAIGTTTTSSSSSSSEQPVMYVNNAPKGYCGVCNSGRLVGEGATSCEQQDTCQGFTPPSSTRASPTSGGQGSPFSSSSSAERPDDKDHFILLSLLQPTTTAGVGPALLNRDNLADAVREVLSEGTWPLKDNVTVTVYSTVPDLLVASMMPEPEPSPYTTDEYNTTHHYKLAMVAASQEDADMLEQVLQESDGSFEQEGGLAERVRAAILNHTGVAIGNVGLEFEQTIHVPAHTSKRMLHHRPIVSLGTFSVLLSDPGRPAVPVDTIHHGVLYDLHVDRFTPHSDVRLELHHFNTKSSSKEPRLLTSLGTVTVDSLGKAKLVHRFEEDDGHPDGSYYIKAVDLATEAFGLSPSYSLLKGRPRTRKLYGTSLWV